MYSTRSKHLRVRTLFKDHANQHFCYNMCSPEPIKNWNDGKSSIEINIQCWKFGQFYGSCTSTGGMWQDKGISSQTKSERIELDRPSHQPADHVARGELVVRLLPERRWPRPRDTAPPGHPGPSGRDPLGQRKPGHRLSNRRRVEGVSFGQVRPAPGQRDQGLPAAQSVGGDHLQGGGGCWGRLSRGRFPRPATCRPIRNHVEVGVAFTEKT